MSIIGILKPATKNQAWSHIYCNELDAKILDVETVTIADLTVQNLTVTDDAFIGLNNFNVINGAGTNGQVLSTDGSGHINWVSAGSGDVIGPGSSIANHLASFSSTSGKLLADSGVLVSDRNIGDLKSIIFEDQSAIVPPSVGTNRLYSSDSDSRIYALNGALDGGKVALWTLDLDQELKTDSNVAFNDIQAVGLEVDGGSMILNDGVIAGSATINFQSAGSPTKYIDVSSNILTIKNSAAADIVSFDDSKVATFEGNVNVVGSLSLNDGTADEYKMPTSYGVNRQVMASNGAGLVTFINITSSYCIGMGGDIDMALKYANVNGDANGATSVTFGAINRVIIPSNSILRNISFVTTSGDNTSELDINVNGVSHIVLLGGSAGIIPTMDLPISQGQTITIQKTINGTMPGVSNFILNFGG